MILSVGYRVGVGCGRYVDPLRLVLSPPATATPAYQYYL